MSPRILDSRFLIPLTVFVTVGGLFGALWKVVHDRATGQLEWQTRVTAEQVATRIEEKIGGCVDVLRELCDDWRGGLVDSQRTFERRAESILRHHPGLVAVDWVDETGTLSWTVPPDNTLLRSRRVLELDPAAGATFRRADSTNSVRITPLMNLSPELRGLLVFLPLTLESHEGGTLSGAVLAPELIEDALTEGVRDGYAFVVSDANGETVYQTEFDPDLRSPRFLRPRPITIEQVTWQLSVAAIPQPEDAMLTLGINLSLGLGLLVAAGMALVSARLLTNRAILRESEERLRAVAEHIPGVVYSYDSCVGKPRTLIYLGPGLESIIGPRLAERVEQNFDLLFELIHPDDLGAVSDAARRGSELGETVHCEARVLTDEGSYRWVRSLSRPMRMDHERTRWHIVLIDISEHRRTVDALRDSEERYRRLVESSPVGVIIHRQSIFQFVNPAAVRLLGYNSADELIGEDIYTIIPPAARPKVMERIRNWGAGDDSKRYSDERLVRRDGTEVDVDIFASNVSFGGEIARQILLLDTTEQRQAEQRQRLLMQELDHRVKNNLASVLALLDQTAASSGDINEFRSKFANRVKAMARTHEMLARSKWTGVELTDIVRLSLAPHLVEQADRVRIAGESIVVRPRPAMPLALALHELATNALKYGSLSRPDGRVHVQWTRSDGSLTIQWSESGGPQVVEPGQFGTGLRLVRGLVEFELGGSAQFRFSPEGLVCSVSLDAETLTHGLS